MGDSKNTNGVRVIIPSLSCRKAVYKCVSANEKLALSSAEKSLMLDEDKLLSIERISTSFGVVVEFSTFSAILTIKCHQ